jgi:hypothetical protein
MLKPRENSRLIRWSVHNWRGLGAFLGFQSCKSLVESLVMGIHVVVETFHLNKKNAI